MWFISARLPEIVCCLRTENKVEASRGEEKQREDCKGPDIFCASHAQIQCCTKHEISARLQSGMKCLLLNKWFRHAHYL